MAEIEVGPLTQRLSDDEIDELHTGLDEHLGSEVRVGAAGGGAAVQYREGAGGNQLLGGDPVDIQMVNDGDVTSREMLDQHLGTPAQARRRGERAIPFRLSNLGVANSGVESCYTICKVSPLARHRLWPAHRHGRSVCVSD